MVQLLSNTGALQKDLFRSTFFCVIDQIFYDPSCLGLNSKACCMGVIRKMLSVISLTVSVLLTVS